MANWMTGIVLDHPDHIAPGGNTEIRLLPNLERGELSHATLPAGQCSSAARSDLTEMFYILEGIGQIWRADGAIEEITDVYPNCCVVIPAETRYQFRSVGAGALVFIVAVMPRWYPEAWHKSEDAFWDGDGVPLSRLRATTLNKSWTRSLPLDPDYLAPDGSEIRRLLDCEAGGLAHCRLPAGSTTQAVRHRTVDEIWYVLDGVGEVWRRNGSEEEVVSVSRRAALTIPCGTSFQFQAKDESSLSFLIGTFPRWPGPDEAAYVDGHWRQSTDQGAPS